MKLCSRLLMVSCLNFCEKRQSLASEPHFGEVRVTLLRTTLVDGSLESPWSTLYSPYLNFFVIYYGSGVMRLNVYSSAVFAAGSTSLHSTFTWTGSFPATTLGVRKLETLGYPDGEDRIPLRSLILTQYRSVPDERTDRRTDGFAVVYKALAKRGAL